MDYEIVKYIAYLSDKKKKKQLIKFLQKFPEFKEIIDLISENE
jgi:hypothetical protein